MTQAALASVGLLLLFTPAFVMLREIGSAMFDEGERLLWYSTKSPEQVLHLRGSVIAGAALLGAALTKWVWSGWPL